MFIKKKEESVLQYIEICLSIRHSGVVSAYDFRFPCLKCQKLFTKFCLINFLPDLNALSETKFDLKIEIMNNPYLSDTYFALSIGLTALIKVIKVF